MHLTREIFPYEHRTVGTYLADELVSGARAFQAEKERIFCREWIGVCREEELPNPGDSLVIEVLGESILLVRNREGQLRAFYNVCRHRGSRLCRAADEVVAPGRVALAGGITAGRLIVCPYHQWSYDLNGALVAAPHLSGSGFNKQEFHLYPVGIDTWGGFVFLNLTPSEAQPLATQLERYPGTAATLSPGATAHRLHDSLRGCGELENHLRELQRVLPLRRRSS